MKPAATSSAAPRGLTAMGIFLTFGMCMAGLAAATLTWPGTALDHVWKLNPHAYARLAPIGRTAGLLFFLLTVVLALAAAGWHGRRAWGWRLATFVVAAQLLGDIFNTLTGHWAEGLFGVTAASALLVYLSQQSVRSAFTSAAAAGSCSEEN
jgi:hypothetical protein